MRDLRAKSLLIFVQLAIVSGFASGQAKKAKDRDDALDELASAERAFAAETVKVGFRDGFIKYFADDGINFGPHPQNTKQTLVKLPPPTGQRTVIFDWAPMFGDISLAGDLGYTTGPVLFTPIGADAKAPRHAIYFSVWQKQADGFWKVAIDMGVDTPQAVAPLTTAFTAAEPVTKTRAKIPTVDDYRKLDWAFWGTIAKTSPAKGYDEWLADQFRVHRNGVMPVTDRKDLRPVISQTKFEFIDGKIASSNDLAFTYGKYTTVNDPKGIETGYYVHVWRRDATGKWKLVVDVQNPLPKEQN